MKLLACLTLAAATLVSMPFSAEADVSVLRMTGVIKRVHKKTIVIRTRGGETLEIARDKNMRVKGNMRPGRRVTISYTMTAQRVDVW